MPRQRASRPASDDQPGQQHEPEHRQQLPVDDALAEPHRRPEGVAAIEDQRRREHEHHGQVDHAPRRRAASPARTPRRTGRATSGAASGSAAAAVAAAVPIIVKKTMAITGRIRRTADDRHDHVDGDHVQEVGDEKTANTSSSRPPLAADVAQEVAVPGRGERAHHRDLHDAADARDEPRRHHHHHDQRADADRRPRLREHQRHPALDRGQRREAPAWRHPGELGVGVGTGSRRAAAIGRRRFGPDERPRASSAGRPRLAQRPPAVEAGVPDERVAGDDAGGDQAIEFGVIDRTVPLAAGGVVPRHARPNRSS